MSDILVDAIVVNYNTRDLLRACLRSLEASRYRVRTVFVVDNASSDGSAGMVRSEFPECQLIEMGANVGFARANNEAFARSDAEVILLLNSDAELYPETLSVMLAEMDSDERVGIVGPALAGADGRLQFEGGRRDPSIIGEFGNISHLNARMPTTALGRYLINDWDHRTTRDVEVLSGACMLIRSTALGGRLFRDDFFMYGEDIELCQRLRAAGWVMRYLGETEVLHHGGASSKKARPKMRVAGVVSMAQLLSRSRGPFYAAGYLAMVPIAWPLGIVVQKVWRS